MPSSLYEIEHDALAAWFKKRRHAKFRASQVFDWIYQHNADNFGAMTNLPAALRAELAAEFDLAPTEPIDFSQGEDSEKLLLSLKLGGTVECVRIRMATTYTACLSSQVGCAVRCRFCATGQTDCERSLKPAEIISQLVSIRQMGEHISNVVFMGMGEPFHNYANVVIAIRRMVDPKAFAMSPSRITVSTSGVAPAIRRFAAEGIPTELTVSLNSPDDAVRANLMPGVRYPVADVLDACRTYSNATGGQPVTFAYVLIEGVNDTLDDAGKVHKLLRGQPHHLNVIPLNPIGHGDLHAPSKPRTNAFVYQCRKLGLNVSLRRSKGTDAEAACGQLRARNR